MKNIAIVLIISLIATPVLSESKYSGSGFGGLYGQLPIPANTDRLQSLRTLGFQLGGEFFCSDYKGHSVLASLVGVKGAGSKIIGGELGYRYDFHDLKDKGMLFVDVGVGMNRIMEKLNWFQYNLLGAGIGWHMDVGPGKVNAFLRPTIANLSTTMPQSGPNPSWQFMAIAGVSFSYPLF